MFAANLDKSPQVSFEHRVGRKSAGAAQPIGSPVELIACVGADAHVGGGHGHRGAMRGGVGDERVTARAVR